jgi:DNA-binding NtrC family response regulator
MLANRVTVACDYEEAPHSMSRTRHALLITDILLAGGGSGVELSALAAEVGIPVLLMSGHPDHIRSQAGGRVAFLAKPFGAAKLQAAIQALLHLESGRLVDT